jgi:TPR repeat protein
VWLLSLGEDRQFEPKYNWKSCHKMMSCIVRRVASKHVASVRDETAKEAEELCASGQCAAALPLLQKAIYLGHLPSRALLAHMMLDGREGVYEDRDKAFELAEEGTRLGCHHCQGVMAYCYWKGCVIQQDSVRSLELARESSEKGSRYGQYVLGVLNEFGKGGVAQDKVKAVALYRLAAAQNLDSAQISLSDTFQYLGVTKDSAELLRWNQLAAAQGHPEALFNVARCHEYGHGVRRNRDEAICWFRRAQAAGHNYAVVALQDLRHRIIMGR